ncbi:MAG: NUDIX hydrolase [Leptospiraceae bacterium]|nr:NUDIX hydrolase [Leptospiraceae bacterium]MDW8305504.1 NUDIX hydrolase [Leptospiraceae bacterium]
MEEMPRYCSRCGSGQLQMQIPPGDDRQRLVCTNCGKIHYQNPKIVVGCLAVNDNKILLCKRNIEPRFGYWTIPSGFMENGESAEEGAIRECHEESGAHVKIEYLHTIYSLPQIHQVYLIFLAQVANPEGVHPTPESSEVRFFGASEIPWDKIAFAAVEYALKKFVSEPPSKITYIASLPAHYR